MKVLLDSCVSSAAVRPLLAEAGHDVIAVDDWDGDPGDEAILAHAHRENRILVTLDKDFGALAIQHGRAHNGIVRLVNLSTREQGTICLHVLATCEAELVSGAIVTAERTRLRIRLPD